MLKWCFKNTSHLDTFIKLPNIWSCEFFKAARSCPFFSEGLHCSNVLVGYLWGRKMWQASMLMWVAIGSLVLCQFDPNHGNLFDAKFLCFSPPVTTGTKVSLRTKPYAHGAPYFSNFENCNLVYLAFVG